ncbi:uncharacterized protein LOC124662821 [Lolium rigidum]|uniref:uncharacterized protein LOC124662821 n=1 Tax=Lolium rigidum TaxID=89674 RepID=UPI001F5C93F4|nr:uncharacterized protein LOC124662821 [Lolium rigidum]
MADSTAAAAPMTIDFLRARLLSERSVSRASKERADQLAARVAELEEQVRAVTAQRRQAEQEAAEVLAILESKGFCGSLTDAGSDNDDGTSEEARPRDAETTGGDAARSNAEEEQDEEPAAAAKSEADDDATSGTVAGGLSWKGRSVSPRKARQLRQRHRRSYAYLLAAEDPSPKYRMGQSCRKNKRKELSGSSDAVLTGSRKGQRDGSAAYAGDGRAELDGEVGEDERSSADGGGQYVIRHEKGGEMQRVLEKQAELIGQYEAEERAQRDWEKKFNDNRSSPKADVVQEKSSGKTLSIAGNTSEGSAGQRREAGEQHGRGRAQNAAISEANSEGCPSHNTSSGTSGHKSSPSSDTLVSKVSDWSSSRFHDQLDTASCQQSSSTKDIDVESVLQALQRARISLQQKLGRPLPPSQVTLALPAPGDEYRAEEGLYHDDGSNSYRGSSPSRQEMLALPAPEDYHSCNDHDHGSLVDGADSSSLTEKRSSPSTPRQEILALPAPGDDEREDDVDVKIPVCSPGLFRLPTYSFLEEDEMMPRSNGCDFELGLRHHAYRDDGDAGVSAKLFYDPHASGRCSVPPSSGFTIGAASLLSGIPELPKDLRRGRSLGDADLFMQRACDYTVTNKWML